MTIKLVKDRAVGIQEYGTCQSMGHRSVSPRTAKRVYRVQLQRGSVGTAFLHSTCARMKTNRQQSHCSMHLRSGCISESGLDADMKAASSTSAMAHPLPARRETYRAVRADAKEASLAGTGSSNLPVSQDGAETRHPWAHHTAESRAYRM